MNNHRSKSAPIAMTERKGEKIGWTVGWIGGFIWLAILSAVFLAQGRRLVAAVGLALFALALGSIILGAPWRHPTTAYWKLMLAPYGCLLCAIIWAIWAYGGLATAQINGWMFVWLIPLFIPSVGGGRRKWQNHPP